MKKFLLVVFIGMVLVMDLYGIVNKYMTALENEEIDHVNETVTVVYEE